MSGPPPSSYGETSQSISGYKNNNVNYDYVSGKVSAMPDEAMSVMSGMPNFHGGNMQGMGNMYDARGTIRDEPSNRQFTMK